MPLGRFLVAAALLSSTARAEFATPEQCQQMTQYRDHALYDDYQRAVKEFSPTNDKETLTRELAAAKKLLLDAPEEMSDGVRAAQIIKNVSGIAFNIIAILTPAGDLELALKEGLGRGYDLYKRGSEFVEAGGSIYDFIKNNQQGVAALVVASSPMARNAIVSRVKAIKEIVDAAKEIREVSEAPENYRKMREALKENLLGLEYEMAKYEIESKALLERMQFIEQVKQDLDKRIRSGCKDGLCGEFDKQIVALTKETEAELKSIRDELEALGHPGPEERALDLSEMQDKLDHRKEEDEVGGRLNAAKRKVLDLMSEKDRALWELRTGRYCSKCRRPASQIEREEHTSFEAHLNKVQGVAQPMPQEEIDKKAAEYDGLIAAARNEQHQVQQEWDAMEDAFRAKMLERQEQRGKLIVARRKKEEETHNRLMKVYMRGEQRKAALRRKADECRHKYG